LVCWLCSAIFRLIIPLLFYLGIIYIGMALGRKAGLRYVDEMKKKVGKPPKSD